MEERRRSRRGKSHRKKGGRGSGCLFIILILVALCAFASVLIVRELSGDVYSKKRMRDSSDSVLIHMFPGDEKKPEENKEKVKTDEKAETPESYLDKMSTEEKVLQLFMITPEALTGVDEVYAAGKQTQEAIQKYPVGGIVYFTKNLRSPQQVIDMITNIQKYSNDRIGVGLLIGVDDEGGQVARISGREEFGIAAIEQMSEVGAKGDPKRAEEIGMEIGAYLAKLGFNLDFAPVADILTNPENTVVAKRCFGADGKTAAKFVKEEVKGLQSQGVNAVLKHFPGHGGTSGDTHEGYAFTERTLDEMMTEEFLPFKAGMEAGANFIMAGHIAAPEITGDHTPASLSKILITDILREKLSYDGIVITDALNMKAITDQYSSSEASLKAFQAGADILLMPENFEEAYESILKAVKNGTISKERLDASVRRILEVKMKGGSYGRIAD